MEVIEWRKGRDGKKTTGWCQKISRNEVNKKKSLEKLEDGKEKDGEKNTKELDDIKGEK